MNDPFIGLHFGNYRIERLLGRGGMARVYLGWDEQLARPVAIKVLDDAYREQPSYADRFLREARSMAAWIHPNIVKVHSAGVEHDITYYVMEYIHGYDLAQVMRQYASQGLLLPYSEVIRIARAVSSALDYAHQEGIIHRDVKPSNVLIAEDGRIVLTDFGLAMNVADGTMGEVFGSPQYISPEQARSSAYAVPQSDLYSLGVMLYELLTGQLPFNDPYPATLALMHINDPLPDPVGINPSLPAGVGRVLQSALSKVPAERPTSGAQLVDALETALQAGEDVTPATMPLPRASGITDPNGPAAARRTSPRPTVQNPLPPPVSTTRANGTTRRPGCAVLIILLLALAGIAAVVIANGGLPTAPADDPTPAVPATVPVVLPEMSPTAQALPPTETLPPSPVATETATVTASVTATHTDTATATSTITVLPPSQTPASPAEAYHLDLVLRDRNLFVINRGRIDFPIDQLELLSDEGDMDGSLWELEALKEDECAALWRTSPGKRAPGNLHCDLVGKPLRINVPSSFWQQPIELTFRGEPLDEPCRFRDNQCALEIPINWGQDPAYP